MYVVRCTWDRCHDATVEDAYVKGWRFRDITSTEEPGTTYNPMEERGLPQRLAKVQTAEDACRFVALFGQLGYQVLLPATAGEEGDESNGSGDPVSWFLAQARAVDVALQIAHSLQEKDAERIGQVLRRAIRPVRDETGPRWVWEYAARKIVYQDGMRSEPRYEDPDRARRMLKILVDRNLFSVRPTLDDWRLDPDGRALGFAEKHPREQTVLRFEITIPTLIESIWWQVAERATSKRAQRICEECGKPFEVRDGRQRFCPPVFASTESPCALRKRQRKFYHDPERRKGEDD